MTRKKRKPVRSIELLSDDLRGQRALKGSGQTIGITMSTLDRWISKAEIAERRLLELRTRVATIGVPLEGEGCGDVHRDVDSLRKEMLKIESVRAKVDG